MNVYVYMCLYMYIQYGEGEGGEKKGGRRLSMRRGLLP